MTAQPNGILLGYARVSTLDQNPALQRDALLKAGVHPDFLFEEKKSGRNAKDRPVLQDMLLRLRAGDTVIIWKLDRLGRSVKDLYSLCAKFQERGVSLRCIQDPIDTTTATGKLFFGMMAVIAEFESDLISERTKAGLAVSKKKGRRGGRKPKLTPAQVQTAWLSQVIDGVSAKMAAEDAGVSKSTLYETYRRYELMEGEYLKGLDEVPFPEQPINQGKAKPKATGRRKRKPRSAA